MNLFGRPRLPEHIRVGGRELPVVATRRAAARAVRLRVNSIEGVIQISLPAHGGVPAALRLLESHGGWLATQVARWPEPRPIRAGASIPFNGGDLHIDWHPAHRRTPERHDDVLRIGGPETLLAARTLRWLKAEALLQLGTATRRLTSMIGSPDVPVRIGDPRGRWGSCAAPGKAAGARIAYSWRLILAPAFVRDNVVAHEVAHLVHHNHSPAFHAFHNSLDANGAATKRWLARHGAALHWVGRDG